MTEKRFNLAYEMGDWWAVTDGDITLWKEEVVSLLNELFNEIEQLKKENQKLKTQLLHGDGVCDICKHEYLVKTGNYYVSKCKKGHEECSTIDLAYCGDFEVKECKE